jgi:hypothetical protein
MDKIEFACLHNLPSLYRFHTGHGLALVVLAICVRTLMHGLGGERWERIPAYVLCISQLFLNEISIHLAVITHEGLARESHINMVDWCLFYGMCHRVTFVIPPISFGRVVSYVSRIQMHLPGSHQHNKSLHRDAISTWTY